MPSGIRGKGGGMRGQYSTRGGQTGKWVAYPSGAVNATRDTLMVQAPLYPACCAVQWHLHADRSRVWLVWVPQHANSTQQHTETEQ
jgi:hypothetical protein